MSWSKTIDENGQYVWIDSETGNVVNSDPTAATTQAAPDPLADQLNASLNSRSGYAGLGGLDQGRLKETANLIRSYAGADFQFTPQELQSLAAAGSNIASVTGWSSSNTPASLMEIISQHAPSLQPAFQNFASTPSGQSAMADVAARGAYQEASGDLTSNVKEFATMAGGLMSSGGGMVLSLPLLVNSLATLGLGPGAAAATEAAELAAGAGLGVGAEVGAGAQAAIDAANAASSSGIAQEVARIAQESAAASTVGAEAAGTIENVATNTGLINQPAIVEPVVAQPAVVEPVVQPAAQPAVTQPVVEPVVQPAAQPAIDPNAASASTNTGIINQPVVDPSIAANEAATEAARVAAEEAAAEASRIAAQEAAAEASRVAAQEAAQEAARVAANEAATEAARVAAQEAAAEASRIAAQEAANLAAQEAAAETARVAAQEAAAEAARVAAQEAAVEASRVAATKAAGMGSEVSFADMAKTAAKSAAKRFGMNVVMQEITTGEVDLGKALTQGAIGAVLPFAPSIPGTDSAILNAGILNAAATAAGGGNLKESLTAGLIGAGANAGSTFLQDTYGLDKSMADAVSRATAGIASGQDAMTAIGGAAFEYGLEALTKEAPMTPSQDETSDWSRGEETTKGLPGIGGDGLIQDTIAGEYYDSFGNAYATQEQAEAAEARQLAQTNAANKDFSNGPYYDSFGNEYDSSVEAEAADRQARIDSVQANLANNMTANGFPVIPNNTINTAPVIGAALTNIANGIINTTQERPPVVTTTAPPVTTTPLPALPNPKVEPVSFATPYSLSMMGANKYQGVGLLGKMLAKQAEDRAKRANT